MEKLLNSFRALCPSTFPVSRWMGSQNPRGAGRILVQDGPSHLLPRGRLPCQHPESLLSAEPLFSNPIRGMWVLERQSHSGEQSDGNRRGSDRLEALSSGTVSSVLSAAWPQDRKAWLPTERLKSHSHLFHGTSARRLTTFVPLLASELAPGLKKALVQDREAEAAGCITQKGLRTVGFQKQI